VGAGRFHRTRRRVPGPLGVHVVVRRHLGAAPARHGSNLHTRPVTKGPRTRTHTQSSRIRGAVTVTVFVTSRHVAGVCANRDL
jgi:hypothetical protein